MSLLQWYRSLSPPARLGLGCGLVVWSVAGLYVSDRAEDRYFKAGEEDKAALDRLLPKVVTVVDKEGKGR